MDKISVIIPYYSKEKTICRCINSIYDNIQDILYEVIIVDDSSPFSIKDVIEEKQYTPLITNPDYDKGFIERKFDQRRSH